MGSFYLVPLIFRYLNSARDFISIDINFNVKIKGYGVSYFYRYGLCLIINANFWSKKKQTFYVILMKSSHSFIWGRLFWKKWQPCLE